MITSCEAAETLTVDVDMLNEANSGATISAGAEGRVAALLTVNFKACSSVVRVPGLLFPALSQTERLFSVQSPSALPCGISIVPS